jgi:hypothetical protein
MLKLLGCVTTIIHTHAQLFLHFWSPQNKIIEKLEVHDVARGAASRYILPSFYRAILCNFIVILIWELCVSKDAIVVNFHPSTALFCTEMFLGTLTVVLNAYPYVQKHQRQQTRVVLMQCYLCLILRLHVSLL